MSGPVPPSPSVDGIGRLARALSDRYTLDRELGAGGMATVYLAHDIKHDRKVAVKVLRPELAAVIGAERFLAEIKVTANLQHPHILPLFDSGQVVVDARSENGERRTAGADTVLGSPISILLFYVMPYVEGISLRDMMSREKQLPIQEAVRIAGEVASALDYAHRHGVIHRDIKPENILLHDGSALVADFGIALAASKAGSRMTETGMSLGTPQYMSPEQAMGERDLDARSDIYALGCVLYEMLTGEAPFTGPTAQAIVAKVMTALPTRPVQLRSTVPPAIDDAIMTALQKLPADRFRTAAEFAAAIASGAAATHRSTNVTSARPPRRSILPWVAAVVACAAAAFFLGGRLLGRHGGAPIELGKATHITWDAGLEVMPALSPDGKSMAYAAGPIGNLHVMVRAVGGGRELRLTGDTINPEYAPAWSPDGNAIAYSELTEAGGIWIVRRDAKGHWGEPVRRLNYGSTTYWSPDARNLLFTQSVTGGSLLVLPVDSGPPRTVLDASRPGALFADFAGWLSNSTIVFTAHDSRGEVQLFSLPAAGGTPVPIIRYDPTRHASLRGTFVTRNGRFYFTTEDRQSDIWVMQLRKAP